MTNHKQEPYWTYVEEFLEELREEIKRLEKTRTNDFARRDFKLEKLNEEFEEIRDSIKKLGSVENE